MPANRSGGGEFELKEITQLIGVIAVMVLVIFAAYFITKFVAVRANGTGGRSRHIRIIDRFSVSKDKMFVLIAVGPSVYLVGVTNQGMTLLDKKTTGDFPADAEPLRRPPGSLNDFISSFGKRRNAFTEKSGDNKSSFAELLKRISQKDDENPA